MTRTFIHLSGHTTVTDHMRPLPVSLAQENQLLQEPKSRRAFRQRSYVAPTIHTQLTCPCSKGHRSWPVLGTRLPRLGGRLSLVLYSFPILEIIRGKKKG